MVQVKAEEVEMQVKGEEVGVQVQVQVQVQVEEVHRCRGAQVQVVQR